MSEREPSWANWSRRSCKTCVFWDKPVGKRAMRDHLYSCKAPPPDLTTVLAAFSYTLSYNRRVMGRDDGAGCMFWNPKAPENPSDASVKLRPEERRT